MFRVPYSSAVGSLMYAMVCTRLDISHAVEVVRRYMNNPGKEHWEAVKRILKYLRGTATHTLCFGVIHYVLEVQTLFYKDMLIQIWQVIKIAGGAPHGMFLL